MKQNVIVENHNNKDVSPISIDDNISLMGAGALLQTCKMLAMQGMQDRLYLSLEGFVILFFSGVNKWPLTWKTKILIVLWICFSLFVALGTIRTIRASRHPKSLLSENLDLGDSQKSYA